MELAPQVVRELPAPVVREPGFPATRLRLPSTSVKNRTPLPARADQFSIDSSPQYGSRPSFAQSLCLLWLAFIKILYVFFIALVNFDRILLRCWSRLHLHGLDVCFWRRDG